MIKCIRYYVIKHKAMTQPWHPNAGTKAAVVGVVCETRSQAINELRSVPAKRRVGITKDELGRYYPGDELTFDEFESTKIKDSLCNT